MITLISFSYRREPPASASVVVDCRGFKNPYSIPALRAMTGRQKAVQDYCSTDREFMAQLNQLITLAPKHGTIACGCLGGKHRSVSVIEMLGQALRAKGTETLILHTELNAPAHL